MDQGNRREFLTKSTLTAVGMLAGVARTQSARNPEQKRPNILFAIADDWSYPHASAYGHTVFSTKAFDRVAQQGCLFTNAFAAAPQCSPNRAALLTGRNIWQIEEAGTHASYFPTKFTVFPDLLEKAGYHIGYTGKGWGPGNWKGSGRERNPAGPSYSSEKMESPQGINNLDYTANFRKFLQERQQGQPFYFWYGASEPHRTYKMGIGREQGKDPADVTVPSFLPDSDVVRNDILDYAVEIEWFDQHLNQMLDYLEEIGELDNTLIVVTSDNGMPFPRAKAYLYEYGIHLPLAICWGDQIKVDGRLMTGQFHRFCPYFPAGCRSAGSSGDDGTQFGKFAHLKSGGHC